MSRKMAGASLWSEQMGGERILRLEVGDSGAAQGFTLDAAAMLISLLAAEIASATSEDD